MKLQFKLSNKASSLEEIRLELGQQKIWDKKGTPVKELILAKLAKIFSEKNLEEVELINKLTLLLNEKSIKEIMYLNLATFDNEISKEKTENSTLLNLHAFSKKIENLKSEEGTAITGLAFIFKFDKVIKEKFNLNKDSLVINCNLKYKKNISRTDKNLGLRNYQNSSTIVWFEIIKIETLNFYNEANNAPAVKNITNYINEIEFIDNKKESEILDLSQKTEEFVELFRNVQRSDILSGKADDGMNLAGWKGFVSKFRRYLEELKKGSMIFQVFNINEITLEENIKHKLYLMHDQKIKVSEGKYKIFSSEHEDIKSTIIIGNIKEFDIISFVTKDIDEKNQLIIREKELLNLKKDKFNILGKSIEETEKKLIEINELKSEITKKMNLIKMEISETNSEITLIEKNIKRNQNDLNNLKDKKNKLEKQMTNSKKVKKELEIEIKILINEQDKKIELNQNFKLEKDNFDAKIQKILQEERINKNQLDELLINVNELNSEIKAKKEILNDIDKEIREHEEIINDNEMGINLNNEFLIKQKDLDLIFKEIDIRLDPLDGEEKTMFFEKINLNWLVENSYKGKGVWRLSKFDQGLFTKFKRYESAITMLEKGIYRNPYLANSLELPLTINVRKRENELLNNSKIELNENQAKAVNIGLSSNSLSYLQGPPGTGKTQTIAAITQLVASNNENTLITSFSHEAINNAFDRLKDAFKDDPNIIFYKNTFSRDNEDKNPINGYDYKHMYQIFIQAMDNFILKNYLQASLDEDLEILQNIANEDELKNFTPTFLFKIIENQDYDRYSLSDYKWIYPERISLDLEKNIEADIKMGIAKEETLKNELTRLRMKHIEDLKVEKNNKIDRLITKLILNLNLKSNEITSIKKIVDTIINKLTSKNNLQYIKKINILSKKFNKMVEQRELPKSIVDKFANDALNKELINVIGITTTGNQVISYLNNSKVLFVDYPVNFEVIDEVSKSTTIEILNTALLAEKIMLAGDYRQLPPNLSDIEKNVMEEFFEWAKYKYTNTADFQSDFESYYIKIAKLFEYPLFKKHAQKLKSKGTQAAYQFLNVQHRFNEEIMEIVNCVYDEDEKLQMPLKPRKNIEVKLDYDKAYTNGVNILDTSFISNDYINFIRTNSKFKDLPILNYRDKAFDQKISLLNKKTRNSAFNEYNAFSILKLIEKIKQDPKIKPSQIGIIAITKSQRLVIKDMLMTYLEDNKYVSQIKIDTVDNFQGRENDIIIVDLVRAENSLEDNFKINQRKSRNLDFYKKIERLNVAVSRARHKLILVGAVEDYFRTKVTPIIDDIYGNEKSIQIFEEWFRKVENKEGVIRQWEI